MLANELVMILGQTHDYYLSEPIFHSNILETLPDTKVIFIVRNPIGEPKKGIQIFCYFATFWFLERLVSDLAQFNKSHKVQWKKWKKPLDINQLIMGQHPNSGDPYYIAPRWYPLSKWYYCTFIFGSYRRPRRVVRDLCRYVFFKCHVYLFTILIPRYLNTRYSFSDEQLLQFMGTAHNSLSKGL